MMLPDTVSCLPLFLKPPPPCVRRSHRSEYEGSWPKFLLLQRQQSRSGRRRRRSFGSAQSSGGHGSEAAHRRIPGVRRLPAPLGGRAGEPDPAAELSPSRTVVRPFPACPSLSLAVTRTVFGQTCIQRHKCTRVILQCTVGPVGVVSLRIPTCSCIQTGQNISQAETFIYAFVFL